jgi:hypothetical protein
LSVAPAPHCPRPVTLPCSATRLHRVCELPPLITAWEPTAACQPPPLSSLCRLHTDVPTSTPPPLFPLSAHATEPIVFKTTSAVVPSLFHPFPSCPCPSHRSRASPSQAKLPVALLSTRAHQSLEFGQRRHPPPFPRCTTFRAPPLPICGPNPPRSLPPTRKVRHRLPGATSVIGATPSRSDSSASTSPAQSDGFPLSLGHPTHSPSNPVALGVGPATPRASTRRW